MTQIKVNLGPRRYNIEIGNGSLMQKDFREFGTGRYAIITDSNVKKYYGKNLQESLKKQGLKAELIEFPAGEKSKTPEKAIQIGRELAKKGFDRNSIIIALGGGIVGDLAGYVASFYERGIKYIQIPTTLLAQVDSSIGGKTGVNIPEGKNMFGCFHQPIAVLIDIKTLHTLPEKEIKNGIAEIIKYGMIKDAELFNYLEKNYCKRNDKFYLNVIEKCAKIKAGIVEKDEKERKSRKILNYGHTIGHAIETGENYNITHGEAIGMGMIYEGKISEKIGLLDKKSLERQNRLIRAVGLPTKYKGKKDLIKIMKKDKKNKNGRIYFILLESIGKAKHENGRYAFPIDESIVRECLDE